MKITERLLLWLGIAMALYQLSATQYPLQPSVLVQNTHLGFGLALVLLAEFRARRGSWVRGWIILTGATGLFCSIYIQLKYDALIVSQGFPEPVDVVVGVTIILVVLEATRLKWGPVLPALALLSIAYYIFGQYLPAAAAPAETPFSTVVSNLAIGLFSGLYGQFMAISANFVFLFMVFGGLLESMDGNRSFVEIGKIISRYVPGGAALTAVVSSSLMGTVTGAAVANVAITGTYTIPIMKKEGYTPQTAAAVEAVASTGGQIVPPVMGSVAFVMAAILSVSYIKIVVAAIIPACLFYFSTFVSIYFKSRRLRINRQDQIADKAVLFWFLPVFLIPTISLTYLLVNFYSVSYAGFFAIVSLVIVRILLSLLGWGLAGKSGVGGANRSTLVGEVFPLIPKLGAGLSKGALAGAGIAVVIGTVGLLAESIIATGAAVPLGTAVEAIAGDSTFITLLLTGVMCIILGAGIPTVGAYVLVSAIAAPIVIGHGIDPFAANFFILYFAILSAVTPPVAAAALAASAIASSGYLKTAWEATLISIMLYVLPFLFIYDRALIAQNIPSAAYLGVVILKVLAGTVLISAATHGYFLTGLRMAERALFALAGMAFVLDVAQPGAVYLVIGLGLAGVGGTVQYFRFVRSASAT